MPTDWSPFVRFVREHQRFFITTHVRPDGDALGSLLTLAEGIESLGKSVRRVIPSVLPPRYDFLSDASRVEVVQSSAEAYQDCDAIVVIDTGTWSQLGNASSFVRRSPAAKFVIDHHATQDDLGGERIVDTSAEAAGRLAWEAVSAIGAPLTPAMANHLFLALAMDTGWFRHSSVSPKTFAFAETLMAHGANPTRLFGELYERNTPSRLKLAGVVLGRLTTVEEGRVAFTEVHWADYEATGAIPLDTEDLIDYPRSIAGVDVALMFMEQRDGSIKVSFRARNVNVSKVAEKFGGGGHRLASGATVPGPIARAKEAVLPAIREALKSDEAATAARN